MEIVIMKAEEAKKQATSLENKKIKAELMQCKQAIEHAVQEGLLGTSIASLTLSKATKTHLEALGYEIGSYSGDQRDPEYGTTIHWRK